MLLDTAKINNPATGKKEPAFLHAVVFDPENSKTVGRISAHEQTVYKLEDDEAVGAQLSVVV